MCKCIPNIRTPFCGKGDCVWPDSKPEGARDTEPKSLSQVKREAVQQPLFTADWLDELTAGPMQ